MSEFAKITFVSVQTPDMQWTNSLTLPGQTQFCTSVMNLTSEWMLFGALVVYYRDSTMAKG